VRHRFVEHTGQRRIILNVGRHDEPHHLRSTAQGSPAESVTTIPGRPVLGEHASRVQRSKSQSVSPGKARSRVISDPATSKSPLLRRSWPDRQGCWISAVVARSTS
jgi:hypothetical protein